LRLSVYLPSQADALIARFTRLRSKPMLFGLCHGDMAMRNLLLDAYGNSWLIDWGCAEIGPQPYVDAVEVLRHHYAEQDPDRSGLNTFLDGVGLELDADLTSMLLLKRMHLVRWAIDRCHERVDDLAKEAARVVGIVLGASMADMEF
jgi:thiamine kinase-like enzyme